YLVKEEEDDNIKKKLMSRNRKCMGTCQSTESVETKGNHDQNVVYVADANRPGSDEDGRRRIASLYSQRGKKGPNQDAVILCQGFGMEDGVFCGVFDGHGKNGHMISKIVRDFLPCLLLSQRNTLMLSDEDSDFTDSTTTSPKDDSEGSPILSPFLFEEWKEACISAFKVMDKELKLQSNLDCTFSGTTAVSIIKQGNYLIIANLGDSRAVMGTISEEEEAERIRKSKGRVFALRDEPHIQRVWLPHENFPGLAMARSFGDFQLKHYGVISIPEVSHHQISSKDQFIVLATDGVWDVLNNEEVVSIVWSIERKEDAAKALVEAAVHAWKNKFPASRIDDCSAACLFLQEGRQGK
ncbi:putative protein phosphatase 2C 12, partial [Ananas comosus]